VDRCCSAQTIDFDEISIQGTLQVGEFLGPPNYGENPKTDRREFPYYMQLPATLSVQLKKKSISDIPNDPFENDFFIQLIVTEEKLEINKFVGRKVNIFGNLVQASTGHHRTPLLLEVKEVKVIDGWSW
jgi:hypothetical protein